jgi:hypothetical protein
VPVRSLQNDGSCGLGVRNVVKMSVCKTTVRGPDGVPPLLCKMSLLSRKDSLPPLLGRGWGRGKSWISMGDLEGADGEKGVVDMDLFIREHRAHVFGIHCRAPLCSRRLLRDFYGSCESYMVPIRRAAGSRESRVRFASKEIASLGLCVACGRKVHQHPPSNAFMASVVPKSRVFRQVDMRCPYSSCACGIHRHLHPHMLAAGHACIGEWASILTSSPDTKASFMG